MKGYLHSVETFGAVDGPGIRYVIFLQGCALKCIYCHNPDSWKAKQGKKVSASKVVKKIKPYLNYIKNGGVTISGGEPLFQLKFTEKLIDKIHRLKLNVALDTAGSVPVKKSKRVLDKSDLILLDIKGLDETMFTKITGAKNKNIFETLDYLEKIQKPVWIRYVLVPDYTYSEDKIEKLGQLLQNYKCVKRVEFLPYHTMGEYKWEELKIPRLKLKVPTKEEIETATNILKKYSLPIE